MGAYCVRTSSLNDKHSCQLFRMGLRDKNHTHIGHTFNQGQHEHGSSISMANLSRLVAASFSSLALFSSSVSTANLSCLLASTFSSLRFLFNSLSSPRFNLLRVARRCFSWFLFLMTFSFTLVFCFFWFSFFIYHFRVLSSAFLSFALQSLKL